MITTGNPWRSEALRNPYPFVDGATLRDASGILQLAKSWILDAKFWPVLSVASKVYLSGITRTVSSLTIAVSSLDEPVGVATITDFSKRRVAFKDSSGNTVGFMTFATGGLQHLHDIPSRSYQFAVEATEFLASVLALRVAAGLRAVADQRGAVLSQDIVLVGGEGVNLSIVGQAVRIDVLGDPYFSRDVCDNPDALGRALRPVRRLVYEDLVTGASGVVIPYAGNISTVMTSDNSDFRARGFRSPGDGLALVEKIGS